MFYVCDCAAGAAPGCQIGSDAAGGTREAPWRTYRKARQGFARLPAGGAIAFCRGGAFEAVAADGDQWVNAACKADNPCVVRDYTPAWAAEVVERPQITVTDRVGMSLLDGGDADHEEGYVLLNLKLKGTPVEDATGVFVANDVDDVMVCGFEIDGFDIGFHVAGSNPTRPGSDGLNERIILRNSVVKNCSNQGWLGGCNGCGVEYSKFQNNGYGKAVFNHNIYLSGSGGGGRPTVGLHAVGNTLYQSAFIGGQCQAVSLVVHDQHDDLLIDGNTVYEDIGAAGGGCWGIAVDHGSVEAFHRAVIQNNTVVNVGNLGIGINGCVDCTIQNNVVITDQSQYSTIGISVPDSLTVAPAGYTTIRYNTVWFGPAAPGSVGIVLEGQGVGHRVVGNTVTYQGTASSFDCYSFGGPASSYAAIDYNHCWTPSAPGAEWERGSGKLITWQLASGRELNSVYGDPQFRAAPIDLTPFGISPLALRGDPTSYPAADRYGKRRPVLPTIGAIEP